MAKMFGRKRNNRNMLWASLIGLGVSAAAYGLNKNKNKPMLRPMQNLMKNLRPRTNRNFTNTAVMEVAKEIDPNMKLLTDK